MTSPGSAPSGSTVSGVSVPPSRYAAAAYCATTACRSASTPWVWSTTACAASTCCCAAARSCCAFAISAWRCCSPFWTSAARCCSSSSAELSSTPEVPPGWSLGSASAGAASARTAARTTTGRAARHRERGNIGPPLEPRGRPVPDEGDRVLGIPVSPGERPCYSSRATRGGPSILPRPKRGRTVAVRRASPGLSLPRPTVRPVPSSPGLFPASRAGAAVFDPPGYVQATIEELGTPLSTVTFVVVDLETTGGSPNDSAITEIGAVKVRGGEVLGEFQTLVDPGTEVPPYISVLIGITTAMVRAAPRIDAVLPAFLEFARGAVLVAHNAPFDIGYLKAACAANGFAWPPAASVDTAVLARRLLTRDEVPNCKLATLAPFFSTSTQPCHRALADARATVDVLHGLFERLGPLGITSLEELTGLTHPAPLLVRSPPPCPPRSTPIGCANGTSPTACRTVPASISSVARVTSRS